MGNQQGKVTVEELAWLAGFVDGEGTITLSDRRYLNKRISPHFLLANTHFPSLEQVVDILSRLGVNAHVYQKGEPKPKQRPAGVVELAGFDRVRQVLQALLPYLFTKRQQAVIVLDFIVRRQAQERLALVTTEDLEALRIVRRLNNRNWTTLTDHTRDAGLEARTCKNCGQAFLPVQLSQVYCTVKCRHAKYTDFGPPRQCPRCGKVFTVQHRPDQIYCSPRCRMQAGQARYRAHQASDGIVEPAGKLAG